MTIGGEGRGVEIEGHRNRLTELEFSIRMGRGDGKKLFFFSRQVTREEEIGGRRKTCVIQGRTVAKEGPREI